MARVDIDKYKAGLALCSNFHVRYQGCLVKRSGFQHIDSLPEPDNIAIPFQFSATDSSLIVIADSEIRIYTNDALVATLPSPYSGVDLDLIDYAQSLDVMFLVHPDVAPQQLSRTAPSTWSIDPYEFSDGPYEGIQILNREFQDIELTVSGFAGTITVTSPTAIFTDPDIAGRSFRWGNDLGVWMHGVVQSIIDDFRVRVVLDPNTEDASGSLSSSPDWRFGSWSDGQGYPSTITIYQGRLWFAGTDSYKDSIWSTVTDSLSLFSPSDATSGDVLDTSALTLQIGSGQYNQIAWMRSNSKGLAIGTAASEYLLRASSANEAVTPTNRGVFLQSSKGSNPDVRAHQIGQSTIFVQSNGKKMFDLAFKFEADQHVARDLTLLADHIGERVIVDVDYLREPNSEVVCVLSDGDIGVLAYENDQNVAAWSTFSSDHLTFKRAVSLTSGSVDSLYAIVEMSGTQHVMRLEGIEDVADDEDIYLDSWHEQQGTGPVDTSRIAGGAEYMVFDPATRQVIYEGTVGDMADVDDGMIVGMPYKAQAQTLPIEPVAAGFDPRAVFKAIYRVTAYLRASERVLFSEGDSELSALGDVNELQAVDYDFKEDMVKVTGSICNSADNDVRVSFCSVRPFPCEILSISYHMEIGGAS